MNDSKNINVVIIGVIHQNTIGVLRSIGEKIPKNNIKLLIVGKEVPKKNILSRSKYINLKNIKYIDNDFEIVNSLLEMKENFKQVIICCSDGSAECVIKNFNLLREWYYMPNTKLDISKLMEKTFQDKIALESGFFIPKNIVVKKGEYIDWKVFPCITKPLKSVMGSGKKDIKICNNYQELLKNIGIIDSEYIQIQEYIIKDFEYQLIGCSLNYGEEVIIPGFTKILRQPFNTNTGYLVYEKLEQLEFDFKSVETFMKNIKYSGLFSLEFIRDKNGNDFFLEINLRNDGNAYCVNKAGINLPYIWCYYNFYETKPDLNYKFNKKIYFMPEFTDFKIGIKEVGFFKWFYQFVTSDAYAILDARDIKPFFTQFFSYFKRIFIHNKK